MLESLSSVTTHARAFLVQWAAMTSENDESIDATVKAIAIRGPAIEWRALAGPSSNVHSRCPIPTAAPSGSYAPQAYQWELTARPSGRPSRR